MFTLPRLSLPSFLTGGGSGPRIQVPALAPQDVENATSKRPRTLKHLLKANHANYAILLNSSTTPQIQATNQLPHILGSAFLLGASAERLNEVYEAEVEAEGGEGEKLEGWRDAPGEVVGGDWREYLGLREYQRAFVDFFEDQLVARRYEIGGVVEEFLLEGGEPLGSCLGGGFAQPLIHLGYAYELGSTTLAIEALAMTACLYSDAHKYIDNASTTQPRRGTGVTSLRGILENVRADPRFDSACSQRSGNVSGVFATHEGALLEHWNAWGLDDSDLTPHLQEAQHMAVSLLVCSQLPPPDANFDLVLVHVLEASHALRVLAPLLPAKHHRSLLRQWWLFALAAYVAQMRPRVDDGVVEGYRLGEEVGGWKGIVHLALSGKHASDAHRVQAVHAIKTAAETWGDETQFYEKAAGKFVCEFGGWGGFSPSSSSSSSS